VGGVAIVSNRVLSTSYHCKCIVQYNVKQHVFFMNHIRNVAVLESSRENFAINFPGVIVKALQLSRTYL
jgi:hypothetical protein